MLAFAFSVSVPLPFVRFPFTSGYSARLFFLSASSGLRLTAALPSCFGSFRPLCFSPSLQPGFPFFPSGSAYSAFCWFPFVLPCFTPAAVPQVLPFQISPPGSVPDFHFLSSASVLASHYSALCSSFSIFFPFSPHSWLLRCSCLTFVPQVLPLLPGLVSRAFFSVLCTWLSVCFLSSSPASLPQLFHRRSPFLPSFNFHFRCFPLLPLSFVRFRLGSDYSASVSSFPFFPFFPHSGFPGAFIHLPFRLFPCFPFGFGTQPSCNFLSPLTVSRHRRYFSCFPFPCGFQVFPLAFALGSGYWAGRYTLKTEHRLFYFAFLKDFTEPALWSSFRLISISQLHTLLCFHL